MTASPNEEDGSRDGRAQRGHQSNWGLRLSVRVLTPTANLHRPRGAPDCSGRRRRPAAHRGGPPKKDRAVAAKPSGRFHHQRSHTQAACPSQEPILQSGGSRRQTGAPEPAGRLNSARNRRWSHRPYRLRPQLRAVEKFRLRGGCSHQRRVVAAPPGSVSVSSDLIGSRG